MEESKKILIKAADKSIMKMLYRMVDEEKHIGRVIYAKEIKSLLSEIVELATV